MTGPDDPRAPSITRPVLAAAIVIALITLIGTVWLAGALAERQALADARAAMHTDAQLRAALLDSEVARFRLLPLALTGDGDLAGALAANGTARMALNRKLESLAQETGAGAIYVLDRDGTTISASNWRDRDSFVGQNYGFRRYVAEGLRAGSSMQFALGTISRKPGLYLSRRTPTGGLIVVKLEFDEVERKWAAANGTTIVKDRDGVVVVTSDPALRFRTMEPLPPGRADRIRDELQLGPATLHPWTPGEDMLTVEVPTTIARWQLLLAMPRRATLGSTVLTARLAATGVLLALAAVLFALAARERRRRQARVLAAARTAELEDAVAARTAQLRHEMEERQASEGRAAILREGLRQANRLATLGQVTASVAHETAQPVAAIRTYAANGARLLERGDIDEVQGNLQAIGRLAERIGTVTAELRGFARKGSKPQAPVLLSEVIDGALLILKDRLRGIDLAVQPGPPDLRVMGGRIRLEQVLVNLLQNAAEALEGEPAPVIRLTVERLSPESVRLLVADNGPGIAPELADRLFTPFATSRESGLGLGLVIAQDIAHDFGGTLRLLPAAEGACFELVLRCAG